MKNLIICILSIMIVFSCVSEEYVIIKNTIYDGDEDVTYVEENKIDINTEHFLLTGRRIHNKLIKVEGLEKLIKLKSLWIEFNVDDLSYLYRNSDLEILVYKSDKDGVNIDFLYNLKKLKILYIEGLNIKNKTIDFKNNKQLEYVKLSNIHSNSVEPYFNLEIINIPDSLRYLDLSLCPFVKKTKKLLDSIKNIPFIFLYDINDKDERYENVDENYFREHSNFIFKPAESVAPEKYWEDTLYSLLNFRT